MTYIIVIIAIKIDFIRENNVKSELNPELPCTLEAITCHIEFDNAYEYTWTFAKFFFHSKSIETEIEEITYERYANTKNISTATLRKVELLEK